MSKRRLTVLIVLALLAGALIGTAIGYAVRTPGRASTWSEIRGWATFVVLALGFPAAVYQLNMQRIQFAEEAKRNIPRDELLGGQIHELQQREQSRQREQADKVDLHLWPGPSVRMVGDPAPEPIPRMTVSVENKSQRPIRDVACRLYQENGTALACDRVGFMLRPSADQPASQRLIRPTRKSREPVIRAGERVGYTVPNAIVNDATVTYWAQFTDDAGVLWQLDQDMHLVPAADGVRWVPSAADD